MGFGHSHAPSGLNASGRDTHALLLVLCLTLAYTAAEVVGGLLTGSLALLADAGHMLSDSGSIGLALIAISLAKRPPTSARSFGLKRAEILAALANGVTLVAIAIWIFVEAARRMSDPPEILGGWMLAIAAGGIAINLAGAAILARAERRSLNVQAAMLHVLADLLGSVGVIVAAVVILVTGWAYADPLVSVMIGVLVLGSSLRVLQDSVSILLEATPKGIDADAVRQTIESSSGVASVHDLHIWTITSGFPALSAHVLVGRGEDCHRRRRELEQLLEHEYGIDHTTLQVDHENEELLHIRRDAE